MITFFPGDVEVQPRRSLNFVRWETAATAGHVTN